MSSYAEYKLIEEAKEELKKAFRANAALRATKVELEKKLKKIRDRLMEQKEVDKILETPKFKKLEILKEKGFLSDIEKEVASEYASGKRQLAGRQINGAKVRRKRLSVEGKKEFLVELVKNRKGKMLKLSDIQQALRASGTDMQVQAWLRNLSLPSAATEPVSGARRDGTWFHAEKVEWLKDHVVPRNTQPFAS